MRRRVGHPPNCDEAFFVFGVEFVGEGLGQGIVEDSHRLREGDAVLFEVGGGFGGVELEAWHGTSLRAGPMLRM